MKVFSEKEALKQYLDQQRDLGLSIGFVPTMGALHQGHLSLLHCAKAQNDLVVVSIYVNPTQFNNPEDLKKYPRVLDADLDKLEQGGCQVVFTPNDAEIYPEKDKRVFDFGHLDKVLEGQYRPGHFNGVAQVVSRLFDIVEPDKAYFGEKDFQQLVIIQQLVKQLHYNITIVSCKIERETDGLAMSSRNMRLSKQHREVAPLIYSSLKEIMKHIPELSVQTVKQGVVEAINANPFLRVEYFDIVDAQTLKSIARWDETTEPVGCIAVFADQIRLIDTFFFNQNVD